MTLGHGIDLRGKTLTSRLQPFEGAARRGGG